jgi:hypothetical protein
MYGLAVPICKLRVFTVKHSRGRLVTGKPERRRPTPESKMRRDNLGIELLGVPEENCQISNIQNRYISFLSPHDSSLLRGLEKS